MFYVSTVERSRGKHLEQADVYRIRSITLCPHSDLVAVYSTGVSVFFSTALFQQHGLAFSYYQRLVTEFLFKLVKNDYINQQEISRHQFMISHEQSNINTIIGYNYYYTNEFLLQCRSRN